jgi:flagellar biosynthesis protein FliQ
MDSGTALAHLIDLLWTAAILCAPMLVAILVVGLLVSVLQVATQIQEMTLTYVPKLIALILLTMILGSWMLGTMTEFTRRMFAQMLQV